MNNKKFLSDVELIRKTFQSRKLVIFVGAGVSMNSGLPSWTNLINQLKDDVGIDSNDTEDALQAAQIYYNEKNHKEYIEKIRSILHHKKNKYNEINEAIFDLKPEHILTTNYDDLLEQVIKKQALPFSIIKKDSEFPYAANTNLLVKIHGDLDNDDFVLKEDDYLNYDTIHPLFDSFIKSMFSTKTVLFIGYSYSDINLKIILQKVRNILGKNYQNSYLLTHDEYSDHKINYLKDKGVNVVSYKKNEQFINDYINGNNASLSFYKKNTGKLRKEGQQLLDLLTFITNYDRFKENLSNLNFIEQMYLSLNRFAEMKTLPYYFIANLYPFNNTSSDIYYDDHNSYSITISNTNLIDYLDENTFHKDGNTKFKESYLTLFHDENQQTKIKEQFKSVVKALNYAGINTLNIKHEFKHKTKSSNSVIVFNSLDEICDCLSCLMEALSLDKLIKTIYIKDITEVSDYYSDCLLAFSHYKIGNIFQSYMLYEEIAQKAWHNEKYITYFIAKANLKKLAHSIYYSEYNTLEKSAINEIKDKAKKIDLDDVCRQINFLSKEELDLIKIIRDDEVLNRSIKQIDILYSKVLDTYNSLKSGHFMSMKNPTNDIDHQMHIVRLFYEMNCIVNDNTSKYLSFVNDGLSALLINHLTYQMFSTESNQLDETFCIDFIHYGNSDELNKIINKYKINSINVNTESKQKVTLIALNYLGSLLDTNISYDTKENINISFQINKSIFNKKYTNYFDNVCLLMSIVHLEKEEIIKITDLINIVLKHTDIFYWENINKLVPFIYGNIGKLPNKFFYDLINTFCDDPKYLTGDILDCISDVFSNKTNEEKINDRLITEKLINMLDNPEIHNYIKKDQYYYRIWYIVEDSFKPLIKKKIINEMDSNFSLRKFWHYTMNDLLDHTLFMKKYIESVNINKSPQQYDSNEFYDLKPKGSFDSQNVSYNFINMIILAYNFNLIDSSFINQFTDKEEYMEFYLDPFNYDFNKFNVSWIFYTFNSIVHEKISNIPEVRTKFSEYIKKDNANKDLVDFYIKHYI